MFKKSTPKKEEVKKEVFGVFKEPKKEEVVVPPQPNVNLDFLNDMFGSLLTKPASPEKPKELTTSIAHDKVGWADDLDIDLDSVQPPENEYETVPEVKNEDALDIPNI